LAEIYKQLRLSAWHEFVELRANALHCNSTEVPFNTDNRTTNLPYDKQGSKTQSNMRHEHE